MAKLNQNPFAFPDSSTDACGMTLRDYFAAHAPISFEAYKAEFMDDGTIAEEDFCLNREFYEGWTMARYEYADAMLTTRVDYPSFAHR